MVLGPSSVLARLAAWQDIDARAGAAALRVIGGFRGTVSDGPDLDGQTVLLLGPRPPDFWPVFAASPEANDRAPDPMDRWSRRIIDGLAQDLSARALYPFGGPPYHPFYDWAIRSGRVHVSPVRLLVGNHDGLWVSFRGALVFGQGILVPDSLPHPCQTCSDQPCRVACPPSALNESGYDVPVCKDFLRRPAGRDCMASGCGVRAACPISRESGRDPAQSAFHMQSFRDP